MSSGNKTKLVTVAGYAYSSNPEPNPASLKEHQIADFYNISAGENILQRGFFTCM